MPQNDRSQPPLTQANAPTAFALRNIADRKARGRLRAAATAEAVGAELAWTDAEGWRYQFEAPPRVTISPKDTERAAATVDLKVWDASDTLIFRDRIHAWDGFPVLVPDGSEHEEDDGQGGKARVSNFRESPLEAARLDLAHTVRVVTKDGKSPWVKDKPGTVSTFYSSTDDGRITSTSATYATARGGTGSLSFNSTLGVFFGQDFTGSDYVVYEGFFPFDTSAIPDGDSIGACVLSLYLSADNSATDFTAEARIYDWGASITTADYVPGADLGTYTRVATLATSGIGAGYNAFAEDGTNFRSGVSKTGITKLLIASDRQRLNNTPTGGENLLVYSANQAGTTQDPKLVVTHPIPNTAPTITAGPTTTYASGTCTTPTVTWGVTFTATDSEQTGADALTYYIRTSATFGAGTQVATGTCTSGSSKVITGLAYNAPGLVNGSQTLYLHIYDGALNTVTAGSFTLLRIDTKPFRRALLGVGF